MGPDGVSNREAGESAERGRVTRYSLLREIASSDRVSMLERKGRTSHTFANTPFTLL